MAFNADNFNGRSSKHARLKGRQFFTYDAVDDTLATLLGADFFLDEFQGIKVGDIIEAVTDAGIYNIEVLTSSAAGLTTEVGPTQALAGGGGAADLNSEITNATSTGIGDVVTLADGLYIGHKKTIVHVVDGGSIAITPANMLGFTTCTLLAVGDACELQWNGTGWVVIGRGGAVLPVIA